MAPYPILRSLFYCSSNPPKTLLVHLSRLLSTTPSSSSSSSTYWHLLRSHSSHPNLETTLSHSIPNPTPSLISSILLSSASPSDRPLALRFFVWAGLHPRHRHSSAAYAAASNSIQISQYPEILHHLLDSYKADNSPVSLKTFKILFNLCQYSNLPSDLALSLLRRMPEFGCRPDTPTYNAVLRLSSTATAAAAIFEEITLAGLRPDMITYVSVVKKLSAAGQLDAAQSLLTQMEANGCSPNVVIYSALLDGACSCGNLNAAVEILEQMEGETNSECAPNVVSYTCLMKCLCEKGLLEEALGVLDRMGRRGCKPSRVTIRTLIKGFCAEGRVDEAYKIIERVVGEEGGVSSDECYSLLIVCLLRIGDRAAAEGLLGRMMERGVRPDGLACNSLMREICEKRCFLDGYQWLGELEEKGLNCIDSDVYSCLLAGLCNEGHLVEAVKLGRRIVESGVRVEASYVDGVVEVLERFGEGDLASQIMRLKGE